MDELAARRCVTPAPVCTERSRLQHLVTEEAVRERRLAYAGGTQQRHRRGGLQIPLQLVETLSAHIADRVHGDAEGNRLRLGNPLVDVLREISLRQDDDRFRAAP